MNIIKYVEEFQLDRIAAKAKGLARDSDKLIVRRSEELEKTAMEYAKKVRLP